MKHRDENSSLCKHGGKKEMVEAVNRGPHPSESTIDAIEELKKEAKE